MKQLSFTLILLGIMMQAMSQPLNLKVWPEAIPGSKKVAGYYERTPGSNDGIVRVEKVTDPEITVYLPPQENATGTAILIIPGGGYGIVAIDHEGHAIAKWLNSHGIAGIVLKYRLPSDQIMENKSIGPLQDSQEAMRIIRRNAAKWKIDPGKVGVLGFSAGGHLASTLSTRFNDVVYQSKDNTSARPDFSILIYPVITFDKEFTHMGSRNNLIGPNPTAESIKLFSNDQQITAQTPPAFLVHSTDDTVVPVQNSILYYQNLVRFKVPAEFHIFQKGGHGYGLAANRGTEASWPGLCISWLKAAGY